ncbi:MAG: crotonase/enoyl-CoA hydratase family protein [Deltaproteobacteria bacterium]|nr:crotonase/enoyl-CoA hydratase family protein [Deltaproteobacteria bacterium]
MSDRIVIERDGGVAHVRLNRPEKRNALDGDMMDALRAAAQTLGADASVRAIVLSGEGGHFSAGLDFSNFGDMASGDLDGDSAEVQAAAADLSRDGAHRGQQIGWLWQEVPQPVVAAIEGAALGGGLHVALGADIRLVSPDAKLGFVEITWGLVPDLSGSQAIRRLLPLDVAKKLFFTGEVVSGERAVALGLGTEVSEQPVEDALALARRIASHSPEAVRSAKWLLNASALVPVNEGLANEFRTSSELMGGKNQIEAVVAKLGKRDPQFEDPS